MNHHEYIPSFRLFPFARFRVLFKNQSEAGFILISAAMDIYFRAAVGQLELEPVLCSERAVRTEGGAEGEIESVAFRLRPAGSYIAHARADAGVDRHYIILNGAVFDVHIRALSTPGDEPRGS